jgi:hypothetical protein
VHFPHLREANKRGPLNTSLDTLMLKPPAATQDGENESNDDSHRQDGDGNNRYGNRPLKTSSERDAIIELARPELGIADLFGDLWKWTGTRVGRTVVVVFVMGIKVCVPDISVRE